MPSPKLILSILAALTVLPSGCKHEPSSLDIERERKATEVKDRSHVTVVKPPVPYGQRVPCESLFTAEELTESLGKEVTLTTSEAGGKDPSAVCSIKLAGEPPSQKQQEKMFNDQNRVLGVLPGDEICQLTVYCGFMFDADSMKAKCQEDGEETSTEVGLVTCVKEYEAGADYRYVVSVLDPDSKCKLTVNPGPSVKDRETPMSCAQATVALLSPDDLP